MLKIISPPDYFTLTDKAMVDFIVENTPQENTTTLDFILFFPDSHSNVKYIKVQTDEEKLQPSSTGEKKKE